MIDHIKAAMEQTKSVFRQEKQQQEMQGQDTSCTYRILKAVRDLNTALSA